MSERLLRFARNDNMQCAIKVQGRCHCEGFGCGCAALGNETSKYKL